MTQMEPARAISRKRPRLSADTKKAWETHDADIQRERNIHGDDVTRLLAENSRLAQEREAATSKQAKLRDNIRKIALPADTKLCRDCAGEVEDGDTYRYAVCGAVSCAYPVHVPHLLTSPSQLRCGECNRSHGETTCLQHVHFGP